MEAYEQVQKGPLKLKSIADFGVTKWKKKNKDKDKVKLLKVMGMSKKKEEEKSHCLDKWTPVQAAFEKQKRWQMERILKKASKTHKDFNRHLDALTEHYDIPKVSWTKEAWQVLLETLPTLPCVCCHWASTSRSCPVVLEPD
ncbi:protein FAM32A-like [Fukomys damarensis]|uniref:protein FAM32A-like n=1 Tax=Fukomys damarensis TaxID=885580 RepID=UPI000F2F7D5E|nr:protein FAM32A-like [Fukomys damarensis]